LHGVVFDILWLALAVSREEALRPDTMPSVVRPNGEPMLERRPDYQRPCGTELFFWELWNHNHPNGFKELGLGSMSLILLHHLLFHLDLRWGGTSYGANRIPASRFARRPVEETT